MLYVELVKYDLFITLLFVAKYTKSYDNSCFFYFRAYLKGLTFADINFCGFSGFLADLQNLLFSSVHEINPHDFFIALLFVAKYTKSYDNSCFFYFCTYVEEINFRRY